MARGKVQTGESVDATALTRAIGARDASIAAQSKASIAGGGPSINSESYAPGGAKKQGNTTRSGLATLSDSQRSVARGNNAKVGEPTRSGGPGASATNVRRATPPGRSQKAGPGSRGVPGPLGSGGAGGGRRRGR